MEPPLTRERDCKRDDGLFVIIVDNKNEQPKKRNKVLKNERKVNEDANSSSFEVVLITDSSEEDEYNLEDEDIEKKTDDESDAMVEEYISDGSYASSEEEKPYSKKNRVSKGCKNKFLSTPPLVTLLRQENPELVEDEESLIDILSNQMVKTKCPSPPDDFIIENKDNFECGNCGFKAHHEMAVARHWQNKHGPRYLTCYACGTDFRCPSNLYKHEKRCDAPDALIMREARARVKTSRRTNHPKSYISELRKKRPKLSKNRELLIRALSEKMAAEKPPSPPENISIMVMDENLFQCTTCGSKHKSQASLARHWQATHGLPYLECYACKKGFRDSRNLYKHERRCTAVDAYLVLKARVRSVKVRNGGSKRGRGRPLLLEYRDTGKLSCSSCPAEFKTQYSLDEHERLTHSGDMLYRCEDCAIAFNSTGALSRHRIKMHKDSTYLCDKCNRMFNCRATLNKHLDTHLPQPKYPCPHCDKRYASKASLRVHVDRDHRHLPPPCACQICPKRYPKMSLLKQHMLQKHGMDVISRKTFLKTLPYLSDSQLKSATVVKKSSSNTVPQTDDNSQQSNETVEEVNIAKSFKHEMEPENIAKWLEIQIIEENAPKTKKHAKTSIKTDIDEASALYGTSHTKMVTPGLKIERSLQEDDIETGEFSEESYKDLEIPQDDEISDRDREIPQDDEISDNREIPQDDEISDRDREIPQDDDDDIETREFSEDEISDEDLEIPPKDLLKYVRAHQKGNPSAKPMVVIKDGQAIFMDNNSIGFYKAQRKTKSLSKSNQKVRTVTTKTPPNTEGPKIKKKIRKRRR